MKTRKRAGSLRSSTEERLRLKERSGGANDQWNRERVVFDLFASSEWTQARSYSWRTSVASENSTWAIFGKL